MARFEIKIIVYLELSEQNLRIWISNKHICAHFAENSPCGSKNLTRSHVKIKVIRIDKSLIMQQVLLPIFLILHDHGICNIVSEISDIN